MTTTRMIFTRAGARQFFVDDKEVDEWTYRKAQAKEAREMERSREKQNGRRFRAPGCFGDFGDWKRETDRKTGRSGRYCGQLARYPGDPRAVFHSKKELIEAAKKRGMVEDKD
jgi:hypothetical protein